MPACRAIYVNHPNTGEDGLWIELSTSANGTLTGMAKTDWPAVGGNTLAQYQTLLNTTYRDLFSLAGIAGMFGQPPPGWYIGGDGKWYPKVVDCVITLSSITPVTISDVTVNEGALRAYKVA